MFSDNNRTIRHEQTPAYSGSKIIYTISENVPGETDVVNVDGTGMKTLGSGGGFGGRRWLDAGHFLAERTSPDFKKRTTSVVAVAGGEPKVLHEEVADKFWSITGDAGAQPSPDGKWIAFLSDRDGWDHIYVMPAAGGPGVQVTKGKFEVRAPQWSPDSTRIAFDANEPDHYGDRHLYVATIGDDPAKATIVTVTSGSGTNIAPQWSPDDTRLVFQHTDPQNSADIWMVAAAANPQPQSATAIRMSDSMPARIDKRAVRRAGERELRGTRRQAGAGVAVRAEESRSHEEACRDRLDSRRRREPELRRLAHATATKPCITSFINTCCSRATSSSRPTIAAASATDATGANDVYMDVGGNDAKDARMAATYLKTLGYVDSDRVGVWGLSYGGFFTLLADHAGADLVPRRGGRRRRRRLRALLRRSVSRRLDDEPHRHAAGAPRGLREGGADVTRRSDPASAADSARDGGRERAVHSLGAADRSSAEGREGRSRELHDLSRRVPLLHRELVVRDAWHRVDEFFDANLKTGAVASH